ncbi:MAG: hypothetical protein AAB903_00025, partial [Patescibacteria group bacterium]
MGQWSENNGAFSTLIILILIPTVFTGGQEYVAQGILFACIALIALLIPTKIPLKNWPLQVIF